MTSYFDGSLSKGFRALYASKTFVQIGVGFFGIFLPIFLYELFGRSFPRVAMYYLVASLAYLVLIPLGARFLNRFGFRRALQLSSIWGALFYAALFFTNGTNLLYLVPVTVVILTLFRLCHWLPYHVDFAKFSDEANRGREVGLMEGTAYLVSAITPVIAGFAISRYGFGVMFIVAMLMFLVSLIPLLRIPRTREKFTWGYRETWSKLLSREHRQSWLAFAASGAESTVGMVIWPIFIYELLRGNYVQIGVISALVISTTVLLQLLTGRYVDRRHAKREVLHLGSVLYALGWVLKAFIATALQIFIIDVYHRATSTFSRTAFGALMYDFVSKEGHYVDEFTVIHEMTVHLGRVVLLAFAILVAAYFPLAWTFLLAAIAALLQNLIESYGDVPQPTVLVGKSV